MKKTTIIVLIGLLTMSTLTAQHSEQRELEDFHRVQLDGNIRLFLIQGEYPSVLLETRRERHLQDYVTEVRNGTLHLYFKNKHHNDHKVKVYLNHTGIDNLHMDGFVRLRSDDPISEETLTIKGDGFITGRVAVDVEDLQINLDGFTSFTVSGTAQRANLRVDGFGKIDAKHLEVGSVRKSGDGLTMIRLDPDR